MAGMSAGIGELGMYGPTPAPAYKATPTKVMNQYGKWVDDPYATGQNSASAAAGSLGVAKQQGDVDYNVDATGQTNYTNQSAQARETDTNQAKLQAEAEARRMSAIQGLWGMNGGASAPQVVHDPDGNADAVRAAAFARAKDSTGALAASQMRGVEGEMSSRGLSGSPLEALRSAGVLGGARGGLDALIQRQMEDTVNRGNDVSDLEYQGNITQRGQTLQAQQQQIQQLMGLFSTRY